MASVCGNRFLEALCHSPLLSAEQHEQFAELSARFAEPRELAHELMRRSWLTAYQINQLFLGRGADLVLGQYILLERIGEGGMGQVFKARQISLNRIVALKLIRKEALSPRVIARFEREIQALAQLSHPNIVHAFDADHVGQNYFYAMEYVDGIDLSRLVKQSGPLPVEQACDYIRQAALGLQHAHERGMVHRDIKPANLLVTQPGERAAPNSGLHQRPCSGLLRRPSGQHARPSVQDTVYPWGQVKLLDLGLARWQNDLTPAVNLTQLGSVMGTPDFIAPEQARDSHTSDIRADLYSLGATLYYLLAGQLPFPKGQLTDKLMQHQYDQPEPVEKVRRSKLLGGAPAQLDRAALEVAAPVRALVQRLMAKRPEDRPQTPGEVAGTLADLARRRLFTTADAPSTKIDVSRSPAPAPVVDVALAANPAADAFAPTLEVAPPPQRPRRRRRRSLMLATATLIGLSTFAFLSFVFGRPAQDDAVAPGTPPDTPSETAAAVAWKQLGAHAKEVKHTPDAWRQELLAFRTCYPGSAEALQAGRMIAGLKSPLDELDDPRLLPKMLRFAWQPKELIAILGERQPKKRTVPLCVRFSPDGKLLAAGHDDWSVRLHACADPLWPTRLTGHTQRVLCVAFAPDGNTLATGGADGKILVWSAQGKLLKRLEGHADTTTALAFAPDGSMLASAGGDGAIKLWKTTETAPVRALHAGLGLLLSLAFAPDGQTLVAGGVGSMRWYAVRGFALQPRGDLPSPTGSIKVVAFSPDGKTLVAGGGNGTLYLCNVVGHSIEVRHVLAKHAKAVHDVAFAPDGKTFLSGGEDTSARIWDAASGGVIHEWPDLRWRVHGVAYAPDGRHIALANANGAIYLLRLAALR